jgi:hypothetical protein
LHPREQDLARAREHCRAGDPAASIASAKQREPERQKLAGFLETTAAVMGVA